MNKATERSRTEKAPVRADSSLVFHAFIAIAGAGAVSDLIAVSDGNALRLVPSNVSRP
jgi:hypothetical protein